MKTIFVALLALIAHDVFAQAPAIPAIYLQTSSSTTDVLSEVYTPRELEITQQLQARSIADKAPLRIATTKESADYIWILSKDSLWAWILVDRRTKETVAYANDTLLYNNVLKDVVRLTNYVWDQKKYSSGMIEETPPPVPTAAAKEITIGMTAAEVVTVFGVPDTKATLGEKVIYRYPTMTVEFLNDKVIDVKF